MKLELDNTTDLIWRVTVVKRTSKHKLKLKEVGVLGYVRCTPQYAYELSWKRNDILIKPAITQKVGRVH